MELQFERTTDDIIAFNLYHMQHTAVSRRDLLTWRIISTVLAMALAGGFYLFTPRYFNWVLLGAVLVAGLTVFLLYPVLIRWSAVSSLRRMLKAGDNESVLGPQVLRISPEGIFVANRSGESTLRWSAVQGVSESDKHLFLFISSINALVIPKSCFKTEADKQAFLQLVDNYRRAA